MQHLNMFDLLLTLSEVGLLNSWLASQQQTINTYKISNEKIKFLGYFLHCFHDSICPMTVQGASSKLRVANSMF